MKIIFFEDLRRERSLVDRKMRSAGIDPAQLVLSARVSNWLSALRVAWRNQRLFLATGFRETTEANAIYRSYGR